MGFGLWLSFYGWGKLHRGVWFYDTANYRQTVFSPGVIAAGLFFACLAFLPPAKWVEHWILPPHKHKNRLPRLRKSKNDLH